jgi:TetR/AcrR family fatty acid metabolism transcriptional regulator
MRTSDKHNKIIHAATKVFARKGFFNARISDIAKEAKVADGTIYLYFNNKFDILITLFEEEIGKLILEIKQLIKNETDPAKKLAVFALYHMKLVESKKELVEVLQLEIRQSNTYMKEYRNTKFIEYIDIIASIIQQGQETGLFRKDIHPGIAKRAYLGALDEMSRLWLLTPDPPFTTEQAAQQISSIFVNGLK